MNHLHAMLLLAPTVGLGIAPLPTAPQANGPGLIRILPQHPDEADSSAFDADAWRARISSNDLDRREQDFDALAQLVRRNPAAREAVERWAREGDGELAWTARLLLRNNGVGRLLGAGAPHALWLDLPDGAFGGSLPGFGGEPDAWLHELEPLLGDDFFRSPSVPTPPSSAGPTNRIESFQLRSGPDGVHVTVEERTDGKTETKEYSAATLDELYEQHPELRERVQARDFSRGGLGAGSFGHALLQPTAPRTDVLGVSVRPLPKSEAAELGLEEGLGLYVERVEPRSIAAALGIQRGHVLVRLNDRDLHAAQDITEQLCARPADGELRVELIDRWGQKRSRTWQPEAAQSTQPAQPGDSAKPRELKKI